MPSCFLSITVHLDCSAGYYWYIGGENINDRTVETILFCSTDSIIMFYIATVEWFKIRGEKAGRNSIDK